MKKYSRWTKYEDEVLRRRCLEESQMGKADTDKRWLNEIDNKIVTAEYRGHSYIIYKGFEKGGITHDPDCLCHKEGGEE